MPCYSPEIKATALKRMQPPINDSISVIASSMNIASATLYQWRDTAKKQGQFIGRNTHNDPYDPQTKLNAIIQTAALNQTELSAYCREHGLYPEQLQQWRQDMLSSLSQRPISEKDHQHRVKQLQQRTKQLERDLERKNQALAESAALLVLTKKYRAVLEDEAS